MSGMDSKEYQLALARTRQAMHVHKAVGFMNTSNSARQALPEQFGHTAIPAQLCCNDKACPYLKPDLACRAVVELQRAMQENSIARCPILGAQHEGSAVSPLSILLVNTGYQRVQASRACPSFASACCDCSITHTVSLDWSHRNVFQSLACAL